MKKFLFTLFFVLLLSIQGAYSQNTYRSVGGSSAFKVVTDTTNNMTGAGKTFWFGSQPWIHDGSYYRLLLMESGAGVYTIPSLIAGGLSYPTIDGTNGQIIQTDGSGTLSFTTYACDTSALWTRNAGSSYTYLTNADKVGIGTDTPATKLHVDGNVTITDNDWIGLGAAAGRIEFDAQAADEINFLGARVGFGTSTPSTNMHLVGDTAPQLRISKSANLNAAYSGIFGVATAGNQFMDGSADYDACMVAPSGSGFLFGTGASAGSAQILRMKINKDGNALFYNPVGMNDATLAGTYDLEIGDSLYTGGNIVTAANVRASEGKFTTGLNLFTTGGQRYTLTNRSVSCAMAGLKSGTGSNFELFCADGDGTDILRITLWGKGNYVDQTSSHRMFFGWNTGGYYEVASELYDGGTCQDLVLRAGSTHTTQLYLDANGSVGINDGTLAGTYDLEVGDSAQVAGNLLLGSYGGAYSYIHPGGGAWVASSTQDIKAVGPEKKIPTILSLINNLPVKEWNFDAEKIKEKFKDNQPSGYDTLAKSIQDSIKSAFEVRASKKAGDIAKTKHYTPVAEDWYEISQHFGGSLKEINSEHVMWAMMIAIKQLNAKVDSLDARVKELEIHQTSPIEVK